MKLRTPCQKQGLALAHGPVSPSKQSALLGHYFPCGCNYDFISQVIDSKTSVPRIEWPSAMMGARSLHISDISEFVCHSKWEH